MSAPASFSSSPGWAQRWRMQWQLRPQRERRTLAVLGTIVAVALLWLIVWYPMQRYLDRTAHTLPAAQAALDVARQQWAESAGLAQHAAPSLPANDDPRAAVERTISRFAGTSAVMTLEVNGNDVALTLPAVRFDALIQGMDALQRDEHFYVVNAQLTPLTATPNAAGNATTSNDGQSVRAELLLRRSSLSP